MGNIETVQIVGFSLFSGAAALVVTAFIYVLVQAILKLQKQYKIFERKEQQQKQSSLIPPSEKPKTRRSFRIAFIDRTIWYYVILFAICLILVILYVALWEGQGISITITLQIVNWGRWVAFSIIAALFIGYVSFHISTEDEIKYRSVDVQYNTSKSFYAQVFFATLFAVSSMVSIVFATLSQNNSSRIFWIVISCIFAALSLIFHFIPRNSFFEIYYDIPSSSSSSSYNKRNTQSTDQIRLGYPMSIQRIVLLTMVLAFFLLNILIWFLSNSNEFVVNGLTLYYESLSYLILDSILIYMAVLWAFVCAFKDEHQIDMYEEQMVIKKNK